MTEKRPLVSILVLNYNGKDFLKACFDSLLAGSYKEIEIVLVDNKSTDESVAFTQDNFKNVRILQTGSNSGYSRAYNLALKDAKGKYAILLNNDVEVAPDWLEPLVESAENDQSIGALQPKILSLIDEGYFEYAGASGGYMDKYGYPFLRGRVFFTTEKDEKQYDDDTEVFWTSGAAMFVRISALQYSMDLDEDFVHHMEEIDLCWRLHLSGYKLKVIPKSVIWHYAGATIKPDSFMKLYWNHRNGIFMMIKNLERKNLFSVLLIRILLDMINIFFAAVVKFNFKHSYAIIRAYIWLVCHPGMILSKRRQVQDLRIVPDRMILPMFHQKSVVKDYFLRGKKTYKSLDYTPFFNPEKYKMGKI